MTSKTSISNKALIKLGVESVLNVDTDDSRQAEKVKSVYDDILNEVLRAHDWGFATIRTTLAKDASGSPAFGFTNRFILPQLPKFLRLISIEGNPEYRIENGFILANDESINIVYIGRIVDETLYDSIFINALAARLAAEVAFSLTSDASGGNLTAKMQDEYALFLAEARGQDFRENNIVPPEISSYNQARITNPFVT